MFLPNPDGLLVHTVSLQPTAAFVKIPHETAAPVSLNVIDVTIRRSLVPEIPWKTMAEMSNKVNDKDWSPETSTSPSPGQDFPAETLKFAGPISIKRGLSSMTSDHASKRDWYEIIYLFQWINMTDKDKFVQADGGVLIKKEGPITWQYAFLSPKWLPLGFGATGQIGRTAWFPVFRRDLEDNFFGQNGTPGEKLYLDTSVTKDKIPAAPGFTASGTFDDLFDINAP